MRFLLSLLLLFGLLACQENRTFQTPKIERIVLDSNDAKYGYYNRVKPEGEIKMALVLFPGFGQASEEVFLDTKFHQFAQEQQMLVVSFAGLYKLTADSSLDIKLNAFLRHLVDENRLNPTRFILGGFSAGGVIALRYAERCHENPEAYPILPRAIFMADAPVDLFHSWKLQEANLITQYAKASYEEAKWLKQFYQQYYGATPSENPERYIDLSPFSIDTNYGTHEQHLKNVAVRAYHDIDVAWRIKNRNQTAQFDNYVATSELINRLNLLGNTEAEFIQTFKTGYRRNGDRHPHSWSIVDEKECIAWMQGLFETQIN